jgi:hypothetical protein
MLKALYEAIRRDAEPNEMELNGRVYTTGKVFPVTEPYAPTLDLTTLTGLVDYLNINIDALERTELLCHVESPETVSIKSKTYGAFAQRSLYAKADLCNIGVVMGTYLDAEKFNIMMQSCFIDLTPAPVFDGSAPPQDTDKAKVIAYAANVTAVHSEKTLDDGIRQSVTIKKGITGLENGTMPNPVKLRPFRTFMEVEQPASQFVFRAQEGPLFALFEADGGAWRSEAMKSIKAYMEARVPGLLVIA